MTSFTVAGILLKALSSLSIAIIFEPTGKLPASAKVNRPVPHPRSSHNCGSELLFSNNMNSVASLRFILRNLNDFGYSLALEGNMLLNEVNTRKHHIIHRIKIFAQ